MTAEWLQEIQESHTDLLKAARRAGFYDWMHRSAVEKYAEPTHFVFELIQNADDQESRRVEFTLLDDRAVFEHWGKPFDRGDVRRITGLGQSAKPNEVHKIGRFGIGFKSVFAITERPEISCILDGVPFAFAIEDLVVPVQLQPDPAQDTRTRFVLPYSAKAGDVLSDATAQQLRRAGPETLMFLNHVEELTWRDRTGSGEWFRCVRRSDGVVVLERGRLIGDDLVDTSSISYRILSKRVTLPNGDPSDVRMAFRLDRDGKVIAEEVPTKLWVFFETEEQAGLRFRVHAPFKLTDSRANIMRRDPFNSGLVAEVAGMARLSLAKLRDEGRLFRDSLAALPVPGDDIPETLLPVAEAIWKACRSDAVVPRVNGGHAPAGTLLQGTAEIRAVLGDDDLQQLLRAPGKAWSVSATQRNDRVDKFLQHVGVERFGVEDLAEHLVEDMWLHADDIAAWMGRHDDDWALRFYQLLNGLSKAKSWKLASVPVVRISGSEHVEAAQARFAPADSGKGAALSLDGVQLVSTSLLSADRNKARRDDAIEFLRKLGVRDADEGDFIRALLEAYYRPGCMVSDLKTHLAHVERFVAWLEKHRDSFLFSNCAVLLSDQSSDLLEGGKLYIDAPFAPTGLAAVFGPGGPLAGQRRLLSQRYQDIKGVAVLAATTGALHRLDVVQTTVDRHPMSRELKADYNRSGSRWGNGTNTDWRMPHLDQLLAARDRKVSLCIWRAVQALPRDRLYARFRHAESYPMRERPASLMLQLSAAAWVPDRQGNLRRPEDMTEAELTEEFDTTDKAGWLQVLGFGNAARRKGAEFQAKREAVTRAGIPAELTERLLNLPDEQFREVVEKGMEAVLHEQRGPKFPERESPNSDRRRAKIAEASAAAPEKRREVRGRTVRLIPSGHRADKRAYLLDLYTNEDGEMVCQCCRGTMPFKLADGTPYFDAVEFDRRCDRELPENHLALCPVCAAKFRHARSTAEAALVDALSGAETLEIPVVLAGKEASLSFVGVHRDDLLVAVGAIDRTLTANPPGAS